jgi:L-Lysine epsilon oxidase N-terminal/L-lysine epsilon oxidase C-terminal domain
MTVTRLRIHPTIGIARVGNSEEYYLGPETMAGMPVPGSPISGGLPIKPGTEDKPIDSRDLRDRQGRLKRQAARFRIYQYTGVSEPEQYPSGGGAEVTIGATVDGRIVKDIVWTVHLANKKANAWNTEGVPGEVPPGIDGFKTPSGPPIRNPGFMGSSDPANPARLTHLMIDPGPRAIRVSDAGAVQFDIHTTASYGDPRTGQITGQPNYPRSFPATQPPAGAPSAPDEHSAAITTLGALSTEPNGRLLVLGGHGKACAFDKNGQFAPDAPLPNDVNNDGWLDDTADGPVTAVVIFDDGGETRAVDTDAWVIATDPAYAPQTTNVVTLWDDLYRTWVEELDLLPALHRDGKYDPAFQPWFPRDIEPILKAASLQKWNVSLPGRAIDAHDRLGQMRADGLDFMIMNFIRDPDPEAVDGQVIGNARMPLSLGEFGKNFLTVTTTQYFCLGQWANGTYARVEPPPLGAGETLDKMILFNCLGGRFSPGIEMTFIIRDINLFRRNWRDPGIGPFRVNRQLLDYATARPDRPFLGVGYVPLRPDPVQPGDLSKLMAIPWHTDYNSCATHPVAEEREDHLAVTNLLYASWPAQRPVAVYTYDDLRANGGLPVRPRFSVRGKGTASPAAARVGRFQNRHDMLAQWSSIGVVMQGAAIAGYPAPDPNNPPAYSPDFYLEVESLFQRDESNLAEYWRNTVLDRLYPPPPTRKP